MTLRLRIERFILGMHGMALLRGWPYGDPDEAAARIATMHRLAEGDSVTIDIADAPPAAAYADWAATYDDGTNSLLLAEEPVVRDVLNGIEPGLALDVACGTGRFGRVLAEQGNRVVAVDASAEMLAAARLNVPTAMFARADFHRLPFADGSVDLAVCALALTHTPELVPAVAELARVVRPGGRLVLSDIHPLAAATGGQAFFERPDGVRGVTRNEVHWPSSYVSAFTASGLRIRALHEPPFEESHIATTNQALREAVAAALPGLPFALVWDLQKVAD